MSGWRQELPGWAQTLLAEARVARLGLLDGDDEPRVLPVTFALHDERLWSAIDGKPKRSSGPPARLGFLQRRPRIALTVDRYSDDWGELAWLQLLGSAKVIEAASERQALAALVGRYQQYRAEPPPGPLIRITVERALYWRAADPAR